eukprot:gene27580-56285_t
MTVPDSVTSCPVAVNLSQRNNNIVMLDSTFHVLAGGIGLNLYDMDAHETGLAISRIAPASGTTWLTAWRTGGYEYVDGDEQRVASRPTVFGALTPARADAPLPLRPKPR